MNNQNGSSLLGSAITIDFSGVMGDLNNANGLITTTGQLSIRNLRDLNNRSGELSSSQSYTLTGRNWTTATANSSAVSNWTSPPIPPLTSMD